MIKLEDILDRTSGGKDIFTFFRPDWAKHFDDGKKFSYRDDDKTASAHFFKTKTGTWILKDFGGDSVSAYDFYVQEKGLLYRPFPEVLKLMAADFGVEDKLDTAVNAPRVEFRDSKPGEPDVIFEFEDKIDARNLRILGPEVKAEDAEALHWHQVRFIGRKTKKGCMCIEYATEHYPIFMRECIVEGKEPFYKLYKPCEPDKARRFLTVGQKPEDYLNGLQELKEAMTPLPTSPEGEELPYSMGAEGYQMDARKQLSSRKELLPFGGLSPTGRKYGGGAVILCSGERDALCVKSLGYYPIWMNSETAQLTRRQHYLLSQLADTIYNIPDIDETGRRQGCALALEYMDIHTVWLPDSMSHYKDNRGRGLKDIRDWMDLHHNDREPDRARRDFEKLLATGLPAKFWYQRTTWRGLC